MAKYDFLIVGAGFFGAVCARKLTDAGFRCLIIEKENTVGGLSRDEIKDNILIHKSGEHILYTDDSDIWEFLNKYGKINTVNKYIKCLNQNRYYSFPLNMNLFSEVYNKIYPKDVDNIINLDIKNYGCEYQRNFEEDAIYKAGFKAYMLTMKGYYEKLYGEEGKNLSLAVSRDLEKKLDYSNGYYSNKYYGIPEEGYTKLIENIIGDDIDILLNKDFLKTKNKFLSLADYVIYTGPIDRFCDYIYGPLSWRKLNFELKDFSNEGQYFLGIGDVRVSDPNNSLLEMIEHKSIVPTESNKNYISYITIDKWKQNDTGHFCINNEASEELLDKYIDLVRQDYPNIIFGGRQGLYRNLSICESIRLAFDLCDDITKGLNKEE